MRALTYSVRWAIMATVTTVMIEDRQKLFVKAGENWYN
jgi:hypothetical protein